MGGLRYGSRYVAAAAALYTSYEGNDKVGTRAMVMLLTTTTIMLPLA